VSWALDARDLGPESRNDHFHADDGLPTGVYRVKPADYAKSGFDRGHLCPSADRTRSPDDNALTFLMTNMHPQVPELNRGDWKKLEEHERALAKQGHEVFVVAGGVFGASPRTIGHGVAVPDAEYKILVVLAKGQGAADVNEQTPVIAVVMPNDASVKEHRWTDYVVTVDEIERQTGYDFLPAVPERIQAVIEAKRADVRLSMTRADDREPDAGDERGDLDAARDQVSQAGAQPLSDEVSGQDGDRQDARGDGVFAVEESGRSIRHDAPGVHRDGARRARRDVGGAGETRGHEYRRGQHARPAGRRREPADHERGRGDQRARRRPGDEVQRLGETEPGEADHHPRDGDGRQVRQQEPAHQAAGQSARDERDAHPPADVAAEEKQPMRVAQQERGRRRDERGLGADDERQTEHQHDPAAHPGEGGQRTCGESQHDQREHHGDHLPRREKWGRAGDTANRLFRAK
jgi:endonuclease G